MSELPEGWDIRTVGELATSPSSISYGVLKPGPETADGILMLRVKDLKNGRVNTAGIYRISPKLDSEYQRTKLKGGEVLLSIQGSVGRVAIVPSTLAGANVSRTLAVIPTDDAEIAEWIWRMLQTPQVQTAITQATGGTTRDSLNLRDLRTLKLPVAPCNEQRRIVAKLEKLLRRVEAAQARLGTIPRILKRFRQSVLAAACLGQLTADWREENQNVGTARELISEVSNRRREKLERLKQKRGKDKLGSLNDFDNIEPTLRNDLDLPDLPSNWAWVDLRFVMTPDEPFCYGVVQPGLDDPDGPRLIRVCDMENGRIVKEDLRGIPPAVHAQYQRSVIRGGELLVSVVGTIGRTAIAPYDLVGVNIARAVAKIPVREFEAQFILLWLSMSRAESWMINDAREVARKTLNLEQLRTLPVPLPPLPEQREIVRRVESLFKTADALEARYRKAKVHVDKLTQSILAKAFRGELVPQDPNDEPAAKLLERLKDSRGSSKRATRNRVVD